MATSDWTQTLEVQPVSASNVIFASPGARMINSNSQKCDIERPQEIRSRTGGLIQEGFESLATNKDIWLQAADSNLIEDFKKRNMEITHKAYIVQDVGILEGDRITNVTGFTGKSFIIKGIEDQAGRGEVFKLGLEENR